MFDLRFGVLVLGVLAATGPTASAADDIQLNLALHGAVFQGETPGDSDPALLLDVIRTDGTWQRVWGMARSFNVAHHVGRVVSGDVTGSGIDLSIEILINDDAWVKGGRASYAVRAKRTEGNRIEGTFTGRFRGKAVSGTTLPRPIHGVFAEGGDEFLCVVTVSRGDPPRVDVQGRGLGATVRVGGQMSALTVRRSYLESSQPNCLWNRTRDECADSWCDPRPGRGFAGAHGTVSGDRGQPRLRIDGEDGRRTGLVAVPRQPARTFGKVMIDTVPERPEKFYHHSSRLEGAEPWRLTFNATAGEPLICGIEVN